MHKFVFCPSLPLTVRGILIGKVFVGMAGPVHLKIPPKKCTRKKANLTKRDVVSVLVSVLASILPK